MYRLPIMLGVGALSLFGLANLAAPQQPAPGQLNQAIAEDAIDVQLRGPLHEAFAQPYEMNQEPSEVIPKEPPPPIPEDPPEQRPEAEDAQWIPGYWAWDSERNDFLWVSGVYRVPPSGRTFIPGYWEQTADGWRWVSGFWSNDSQPDITYTPEPPATLENGPSMPAPDDDSLYIPGSWIYRESRFIWRPGYYAVVQPDRVWVPARYLWTPRGHVFVDSYWDAPFEDRGLIFAPVCFNQPLWGNPGWRFRPSFVLNFNFFFDSAFRRHRGGHYHYGNYYGGQYARNGYRPWYNGAGRYDPLFAHHGWQNRRNQPNWMANQQQVYANRFAGRAAVPPTTLAQQTVIVNQKQGSPVVTPVRQFKNDRVRLVNATPAQQKVQQTSVQHVREVAQNRQKLETVALNNARPRSVATTIDRASVLSTNAKGPAPGKAGPASPVGKSGPGAPLPNLKTDTPLKKGAPPAAKQTGPVPGQKSVTPPAKNVVPPAKKDFTPAPKQVTPPPAKKDVTPAPKQVNPLPAKKDATPAPKQVVPPPAKKSVAPAPKQVAPPAKSVAPAPKQVAPPPAKKSATPAPRQVTPKKAATPAPRQVAPAPSKKATAPAPKQVAPPAKQVAPPAKKAAPAAKKVSTPAAPRVAPKAAPSSPPRAQPQRAPAPPRVSAPPRRSPAPAPRSPAPKSAPGKKR